MEKKNPAGVTTSARKWTEMSSISYARPCTSGARFLHESAAFGSLFVFAEATRTD